MPDSSPEESYDLLFGDTAPASETTDTVESGEEPEDPADEAADSENLEPDEETEDEDADEPAPKPKKNDLINELRKEREIRRRMAAEIEALKARPTAVHPEGSEAARLAAVEERIARQEAERETADKNRALAVMPELADDDDAAMAVQGLYLSGRYPTWEEAAKAFKAKLGRTEPVKRTVPSTSAARGTRPSERESMVRELKSGTSETRRREIGAELLGL